MTDLTDRLMRDRLLDPAVRKVHMVDAQYHAEWELLRRALDAAHRALVADGHPEADMVIEILSQRGPDLEAANARVEAARKLIDWASR